jgi:hypothetical protein
LIQAEQHRHGQAAARNQGTPFRTSQSARFGEAHTAADRYGQMFAGDLDPGGQNRVVGALGCADCRRRRRQRKWGEDQARPAR